MSILALVDESYKECEPGIYWSTLSAVLVEESASRELSRDLFSLKRRFFKARNPYEIELKGRNLFNNRAFALPRNRDLAEQIISLMRLHKVVPLAVAQKGPFVTIAGSYWKGESTTRRLPLLYSAIMRRISTYMRAGDKPGLAKIVFDSIEDKTNRNIARGFTNFLYKSTEGHALDRILEVPFFGESGSTAGIQLADIVAYLVNQRYAGRRADPQFEGLFLRIRDLTFNWQDPDDEDFSLWGITRLRDAT